MFKHILVPLDGSALAECVLLNLIAVAHAESTSVTLVGVLDSSRSVAAHGPVDPLEWQIRKAETESYLQSIVQRLQVNGLDPNYLVLEGNSAEMILEAARDVRADLILLSSHGQSGISGWNVSSTVQKVILRAGTSIMIVRAYQPPTLEIENSRYVRIMLPLDGSHRAEAALPIAETIARTHDAEILVINVVRKPDLPRKAPPSQEDLELAGKLIERNRVEASQYLDELHNRIQAKLETRVVVSETVASALQQQVEQNNVDLVILSAHGYTGENIWPYGSVANSFISYGTTPVLIVQDLPQDRIQPMRAELIARERGKR